MTKFYICTTDIAKGPYTLNDLDKLNIHPGDIIWSDAYGENIKACQVPEFSVYFNKKVPYSPQFSRHYTPSYKSVILSVLLFVLMMMVGYYIVLV